MKRIFFGLGAITLVAITGLFVFAPSTTISTTVDIDASPEEVWEVLSDISSYEEWNPFVVRFEGTFEEGAKVSVFILPTGAESPTEFNPEIVKIRENKAFEWSGSLPVPRMFDGLHKFALEPIDGGTRVHHSEDFRGVLLHLINPDDFISGFEAMDYALKERVEKGVSSALQSKLAE